jgi:hypothetical protein
VGATLEVGTKLTVGSCEGALLIVGSIEMDGVADGDLDGETDGAREAVIVGSRDGIPEGSSDEVGPTLGDILGICEAVVGGVLGIPEGEIDGKVEGEADDPEVGTLEGESESADVGPAVGALGPPSVGPEVGAPVSVAVGPAVGVLVSVVGPDVGACGADVGAPSSGSTSLDTHEDSVANCEQSKSQEVLFGSKHSPPGLSTMALAKGSMHAALASKLGSMKVNAVVKLERSSINTAPPAVPSIHDRTTSILLRKDTKRTVCKVEGYRESTEIKKGKRIPPGLKTYEELADTRDLDALPVDLRVQINESNRTRTPRLLRIEERCVSLQCVHEEVLSELRECLPNFDLRWNQ